MIDTNDILGYLYVLGYKPVKQHFLDTLDAELNKILERKKMARPLLIGSDSGISFSH